MVSKASFDVMTLINDETVQKVLNPKKTRKFNETVEMQFSLKNMPKNSKVSISGILPFTIKDLTKLCIGNQEHNDAAAKLGLTITTYNELQLMKQKNPKAVKNMIRRFDIVMVSSENATKITKLIGPYLSRQMKFAVPIVTTVDDTVKDLDKQLKFNQKKSVCLSGKVGNLKMDEIELKSNICDTINNVLNNVPKGLENIKSICLKSTMSKSYPLFGHVKVNKKKQKLLMRKLKRAEKAKQAQTVEAAS